VALIAFALSGMATLFGVLEPVRAALTESTALELPSGDSAIPLLLGVGAFSWGIVVTVSCVAVIIVTARHTLSRGMIMTGIAIGGLTVAGWWVTGYWAVDEFSLATPASLTFSGPMARTMLFLISGKTSTALPFGIALVAGVLLGAALSALITRTFHWRPPQARYLHRPLIGGVLMGVGAIWAGGCNIVNGLTGLSTGSSEALLATIMILTGVYFGVRWLLHAEHVPFDDEKSSPPIPQHIAAAGDSHDKSTTQPQHKSAA
jgi:hypothetical protein